MRSRNPKGNKPPDFLVGLTVDATQAKWNLLIRLILAADSVRIAERQVEVDPQNPGPAANRLAEETEHLFVKHAGVRAVRPPDWYRVPTGLDFSDYLLRLEQQLAVTCMHLDFLAGGDLSGEHEILDGIIHLCVHQPNSELIRMVLAQTLRQMKKVRPSMLSEYRERLDLLQREHPLEGDIGKIIMDTISTVVGEEASHIQYMQRSFKSMSAPSKAN